MTEDLGKLALFSLTNITNAKPDVLLDLSDLRENECYNRSVKTLDNLPPFEHSKVFKSAAFSKEYFEVSKNQFYKGETTSSKVPHGSGIMICNGNIFMGKWENGLMSGICRHAFAKGGYFEGFWVNGKKHGFGVKLKKHVFYVGCLLYTSDAADE